MRILLRFFSTRVLLIMGSLAFLGFVGSLYECQHHPQPQNNTISNRKRQTYSVVDHAFHLYAYD